jgi:hypothetical protein
MQRCHAGMQYGVVSGKYSKERAYRQDTGLSRQQGEEHF